MATKKDIGASSLIDDILGSAPAKEKARPSAIGQNERLERLPKGKTCTVAFRLQTTERDRLERLFRERTGATMAEAVKKAVYLYAAKVEKGEL